MGATKPQCKKRFEKTSSADTAAVVKWGQMNSLYCIMSRQSSRQNERLVGYSQGVIIVNMRQCEICGQQFEIMENGWTRKFCYTCAPHEDENMSHAQAVTIKRRAIKKMLIERAGGKCSNCGYNKCVRALEFHHLNPEEKDFGISKTLTKSISALKEEVDKCVLLCSNCHAEEHQRLYEAGYSQFNPDIQHH